MKRYLDVPLACVMAALVSVGLMVAGCEDDDDGGDGGAPVVQADLAGTWTATQFQVTSADNPLLSLDLIALGGSLTVTVDTDGNFTGQAAVLDPATFQTVTVPLAGRFMLVDQDMLTIDFDPDIPPFFTDDTMDFSLEDGTIHLYDDTTDFDFDGDGNGESAIFEGELVRD